MTGANFKVIARPGGHVTVFSAIPFSVVTLSPGSNMVDMLLRRDWRQIEGATARPHRRAIATFAS